MSSDPREFGAFWRELTSRVREHAHRRGTTPQEELQQFVLQRVMARQFASYPDDWMIKGGQTLLARWADGRSTSDIDMVGHSGDDRVTMVAKYTEALHQDLGDHLTFELESESPLQHGRGARLKHRAYCGGREVGEVSVDLAPPREREMWQEAELIRFPEQIMSTGAEAENPRLRVISLTDTLAHKVSGMYTQGVKTEQTKCDDCLPRSQNQWACQTGELPYRVQDLVDVLMIAEHREWDAATVQAMLREEFSWRIGQGEPLRVPNRFYVPNPTWREGFAKYAAATPGLPYKTIDEAIPVARAFLNPLLDRTTQASGTWDPQRREWVDRPMTGDRPSVGLVRGPAFGAAPQRILVVAHASGRSAGLGGLPVASGELTKALAAVDNTEVTLMVVGATEQHGDARIVQITPNADQTPRVQLLDIASNAMPDHVPGMPPQNSDSFDLVVGHARFSGYAAMLVRNRWYPQAQLAHVLHMPAERYAEIQGDKPRGTEYARLESAVVQNADLVVGVGPLLAELGDQMSEGAPVAPSLHELVPGVETLGDVGDPPPSEKFHLLFSGRVNDAIKGYDDLLATVQELHSRGVPVELRVRGVKPDQLAAEQARADQVIGSKGVVELLPYSTDRGELLEDYRWAHAAVMPSRIEGYGLVGAEAAAHGIPVLVNAESGIGRFLSDGSRVPAELGAGCVVPDAGLADDRAGRVQAWSAAIDELRNDYPRRRAAAGDLKGVLRAYSWQHAARAFSRAALDSVPGAGRHTVQGPDGVNRTVTPAGRDATPQERAESVRDHGASPQAQDLVNRFTQSGSPISGPAES
ncbi:MAG TPA: glycosyltransferase family 4 protein, partial [Kribbellaceae bacterium]